MDFEPTAPRCTHCLHARRRCVYSQGSWRCDRCQEFDLEDCDIATKVSSVPFQVAYLAGSQATVKEEPVAPTRYPRTTEIKWEQLAKGEYVLVVGVDVGTKNSSACWDVVPKNQELTPDFSSKARQIQLAGDWRIPTQAAIITENGSQTLIFSQAAIEDHVGDDLEAKDVFTLLKLMLADPATQSREEEKKLVMAAQRLNNMILEQHRVAGSLPPGVHTVLDVFREFLRYFWDIIRADIAAKTPLSAEILDYVLHKHTRIVVAAPAIWTSTMNNQFRKLLIDAGFTCAHIRSEPKLISAVIVREQQQDLQAKSTTDQVRRLRECACVVLDIGAGTTDLNSIQVTQTSPVLKFRTLLVGSGSMSGNELLNRLFSRSLSSYLYDHNCMTQIETRVGLSSLEILQSFVLGWEDAKRDFHVGATGAVKIPFKPVKETEAKLPKIPAVGMSGDFIRMPAAMVKAVFDEYLGIIKGLLDQQLDALDDPKFSALKKKKAIFLAGGGSLIPYISQTLISQYTKLNQEVVHHDDNNCSLVAKGGVLAAIDPSLGRHEFSRTTYGIPLSVPYDETDDRHVAEKHLRVRTPSYLKHKWEMPRQFETLIRYGERLNVAGRPAMINEVIMFRAVDISWPLELEQDIYQVDEPAYGLKEDHWSIDTADTIVKHTAHLVMEIPQDKCDFRPSSIDGVPYYKIWFRARPEWDGLLEKWLFMVHPTGKEIISARDEEESFCLVHTLDDALEVQTMEDSG